MVVILTPIVLMVVGIPGYSYHSVLLTHTRVVLVTRRKHLLSFHRHPEASFQRNAGLMDSETAN